MKPIVRCSNCENDLHLDDRHCPKCGEAIAWPMGESVKQTGKASRRRDRREGKAGKPVDGTGLSSTGKLVTGVAIVIVVAAVVLQLMTRSSNQPEGGAAQSVPSMQVPTLGQPSGNAQAGVQLAQMEGQIKNNPSDHQLILQTANFAHDNAFFEKAIALYDQYLQLHPDDTDAIVDKAICYHELQRSDEAIAIMNQALKLQPNHLQATFNLGIINLQLGNLQKANEWFNKVVKIAPESEIGKRAKELLATHANLPPQ